MTNTRAVTMDRMRVFLADRGVKPSFQRLKILEYLMYKRDHPSVDTIFQSLSGEIPTLSKTTIYNTLSLFSDKGIVSSLTVVNNELRYDLMHEPHAHFQCSRCKQLYDIPLDTDLFMTETINEHMVDEILITFKGVCKSCAAKGG